MTDGYEKDDGGYDTTLRSAKDYYDSNDSQTFYQNIWGMETIHIGRYDLLTNVEKQTFSRQEQISLAQERHEEEFVRLIVETTTASCSHRQPTRKLCILDMGCGYGGLLRRLWRNGLVLSSSNGRTTTGVDIASKMCQHARQLNNSQGCHADIAIKEESYLHTSVPDHCMDLVISMDALLHVGPDGQCQAVQEAARVLKPSGWMIFTDIMQQENVDRKEMQPIYDRIHLSELGTVRNYQEIMEVAGFGEFEFLPHSSNVSAHYGSVLEVLKEKGDFLGLSREYQTRMQAGLEIWRDLAPKNIVWGFIRAQKKA